MHQLIHKLTKFPHLKNMSRLFSIYKHIQPAPKDAIFGLHEQYMLDKDTQKVDLTLGTYRDEKGKEFILPVVKRVEEDIIKNSKEMEYSSILGNKKFIDQAIKLVYGENCNLLKENKIASMQTLSGTGALRVAFDFLHKFAPKKVKRCVYISNPAYSNHIPILDASGFESIKYRYYNKESKGIDMNGMIEDINNAESSSIILLQAVAHNPTGMDLTKNEWDKISKICKQKSLIVVFDFAYQGFASGDINTDAYAIRKFVEDRNHILVCQSFAKNLGLYGHRTGCLSITTNDIEEKTCIESQLKILARTSYSNPPIHGARIVSKILSDESLKKEWLITLKQMADRIKLTRIKLKNELISQGSSANWDHITNQIGMFSYTGLQHEQVTRLIEKWHLYTTKNGRINIAAINDTNIKYVAEAINSVVR